MANVQIAIIDQENTQIALSAPSETQVNIAVPGVQGPVGQGVASGGTTNQVLFKQSSTDYDTAWSEITSDMIGDLEIVDADVSVTAAIAGTKISPDFGSQTVQTTGVVSHALGAAATPTITFTGDTNTGIYSPGADQLAISTGGNGRLFVNAAGRVGIGTSNPGAVLDVFTGTNRYVRLSTNGDASLIRTTESGGANRGFSVAGQYIRFDTGTNANSTINERLRITEAGLVGIGTSSPSELLTLRSTGQPAIQIEDADLTNRIGRISQAGGAMIFRSRADTNDGQFVFKGYGGGIDTDFVTINNTGNVGIGTSSPSSLLHLESSSPDLTIRDSQSYTASDGPLVQFQGRGPNGINYNFGFIRGVSSGANNGGILQFGTNNAGLQDERMRITSAGLVGIGTTSPAEAFTLGSGNAQITNGQLTIGVTATSGLQFINNGTFGTLDSNPLILRTASDEKARIDTSGRLLVGASSTSSNTRLVVQGNSASPSGTAVANLQYGGGAGTILNNYSISDLNFGDSEGNVGAQIKTQADADWGASDYPGRLVFFTTADGAASPTERMRIKASGIINFANAPTYASDTAAGAGGLVTGDVYKTADGSGGFNLKIKA